MTSRYIIPLFCAGTLFAESGAVSKVVDIYCAGCHNGQTRSVSGPSIDRFDPDRISR